MDVRRFADSRAFQEVAAPFLLGDPARNNLPLGILHTVVTHPEIYPVVHLWLAEDGGSPLGIALRTEPYNVVLAEPEVGQAADVVDALADAAAADGATAPGVVANRPWAKRFARRWTARTGATADLAIAQGVYALTGVKRPRPTAGGHRPAVGRDRHWLLSWLTDFMREAIPPGSGLGETRERLERLLDIRLAGADAGFWVWENGGEPVSIAGFSSLGEGGTRIGPVYTPPAFRGRGYASNLVADVSGAALGGGSPACFLYTDLANPTSNKIYVDVGYDLVCEAEEHAFTPA